MGLRNLFQAKLSSHLKWFARRKSAKPLEGDPQNQLSNSKVIWDAADGRCVLSSRRGFAVNIAVALLGSGVAAEQVARRLQSRNRPTQFAAIMSKCPPGEVHTDYYNDEQRVHVDCCNCGR